MPELPDIEAYISALKQRLIGAELSKMRIASPFLLRTVSPAPREFEGSPVKEIRRIGKRIAIGFDTGPWMLIHLMIAGRFQWKDEPGAPIPRGKQGLAGFDFSTGTLILTEAGSKRRASLSLLAGAADLAAHDPGGLEVLDADSKAFAARLTLRNHTLKRALTDPRLFSGIGNAYSDEILHRARLSPIAMTQRLREDQIAGLFEATQASLIEWRDRLVGEAEKKFPTKVTAFRPEMAVHGKFGKPCPVCQTAVQRIVYASTETNYCPRCQTGGKVLADRALSTLMKKDWPKTIEELEDARPQPAT
ncbi:MAG: DNA-formamidopyrimidine glycosylase family protein [Pseudomonadota bacterium]